MADLKYWTRTFIATAGAVIAGPGGALIGTFLGGIVGALLPGTNDFANQVFTNLGRISIEGVRKKIDTRLSPVEKKQVNHDLQTAFRDAFKEALYDIGGSDCFPQLAIGPHREVPPAIIFSLTAPGRTLWQRGSPLAAQVRDCMQFLEQAVNAQQLFPINPPQDTPSASVYAYLQAETPEQISLQFYQDNIFPLISRYHVFLLELPEFELHLRQHIYPRTLLHLNEHLKQRTPAWRAFNRLVLEGMQEDLNSLSAGQSEMLERLNAILSGNNQKELGAWTDQMAGLLGAAGSISTQMGEGFDSLSERIVAQHQEIIGHLDQLARATSRIETKVDLVLEYLKDTQPDGSMDSATIPLRRPPAPGESPYKGLQYFSESDSDLFYGRERWIEKIITRLIGARFLGIIGASGSGKSSIIRAGVIPALKGTKDIHEVEFRPEQSDRWPILLMTPSSHPLESLATVLTPNGTISEIKILANNLHEDATVLDFACKKIAAQANSEHCLLVVDQFEEMFSQCQDLQERQAFVAALMSAANPEQAGPLILILILRADFYGSCAEYDSLRSALAQNQEFIGPMSTEELRRAIELPAQKNGWKLEAGLVDIMIKDVGSEPGALPLLSHALLETWRNRSSHTMTLESYNESGGVRGAIAKTAEMIFNQRLNPDQQIMTRNIFLRLTNVDEGSQDTRRSSNLSELIPSKSQASAVEKVLQLLVQARLITIETGSISIAHEALIREWPKLRQWIDENRAGIRIHQRLSEAAQEWLKHGKDEGLLYRGFRLREAEEWANRDPLALNDLEMTFLQICIHTEKRITLDKEEQQRRELETAQKLAKAEQERAEEQARAAALLRRRGRYLQIALAGVGLLAFIALILTILAANSSNLANQNAQVRATAEAVAQTQSRLSQIRELAARSRSLSDYNPDLSLLLGAQAVKQSRAIETQTNIESQSALYHALTNAVFETTLRGHADTVYSAIYSPDGKMIVSSGFENKAILWDQGGKKLAELVGHSQPITSSVFDRSSTLILTASLDGTAKLWSLDGKLKQTLVGHLDAVNFAFFSPDSKKILTGSKDGTVRIWLIDGTQLAVLKGHDGSINYGAFSPDQTKLVTAGTDNSAIIWSIDGVLLHKLTGHSSYVMTASFSPDNQRILTASWDGTAKVWSKDGNLLTTLTGHNSSLNMAMFNKNGTKILSAAMDNTARLWSSDGTPLAVFSGHTQQVTMASFSPEEDYIATASQDSTIRLWLEDGTPLSEFNGHTSFVNSIWFSPDGKHLVSAGSDPSVRIWPMEQAIKTLKGHYGNVNQATFSPDGSILLTSSNDGFIRLWRKDGIKIGEFRTYAGPIDKAVFSPDGKKILTALYKGMAIVYQLDGTELLRLEGHTNAVNDARFSPDGTRIVTASRDKTAKIWSSDGRLIATLKGHTGSLNSARFSWDGSMVVTAGDDFSVRFWKSDGAVLPTTIKLTYYVSSAVFSRDGTRILVACWDGNAYLYQLDGSLIATYKGHTSGVLSAEFNHNDQQIVTASIDSTARLWNINGNALAILEGHTNWINSAEFNPGSSIIVTAGADGTARFWNSYVNVDQMVEDAYRRVGRSMEDYECKTYLYVDKCP